MNRARIRAFLARRLSREEYLGLRLTIGLLLSVCLLVCFGLIARSVEGGRGLTRLDQRIGLSLAEHRERAPLLRDFFLAVTQLGSVPAMVTLAVGVALALVMQRRRLLALVWLIAPAGGALLDVILKHFFERGRPPFHDPAINETTLSFPSGHSMGSVVGYGLLAYLLVRAARHWWMRLAIIAAASVLVLAIGFSRIFLGAHYFSDVLGGYTVGGFWLASCILTIEAVRRRPRQAVEVPPTSES
jgi:membrane-associated phospholipid phosphatase